ncbi:hypothetical protein [uncultured Kocuria sp.]|uniref:hypothetical protein n=1 Tax=uncultured Kocuria sp. TaxID=259305 RepID=UPI00259986DD|nr:hypothetical protein [uncultured Kocuria sp.]MCT1368011.1 hypothetical protein [Rothia sp. p3-SID1597]
MSIAGIIRATILGTGLEISLVVALTLVAIVLWSSLVATSLPPVIAKCRLDRAVYQHARGWDRTHYLLRDRPTHPFLGNQRHQTPMPRHHEAGPDIIRGRALQVSTPA